MQSDHTTHYIQALSDLSPITDIIADAKAGKMYILVDDEDRENEGDIMMCASCVTPYHINFMITHARGLVCMPITTDRADDLHLALQTRMNNEPYGTAFTTSVEARTGVTTGISAPDRTRTIQVLADDTCDYQDIVTPGHIFPLIAHPEGVLSRRGHTEAGVDIARLAGHHPSAVICEIINEDGTMARLPQVVEFARKHNIKVGTIADLVTYCTQQGHNV